MTSYSMGFCFDDVREHVLLMKKTKPEWQAGFLNAPGGTIEANESPLECMTREFEEETGIYMDETLWCNFLRLMGDDFNLWVFYTYRATMSDKVPFECDEGTTCLVNVQDVLSGGERTIPNLPWMIGMALFDNKYSFEVFQDERKMKPYRVVGRKDWLK